MAEPIHPAEPCDLPHLAEGDVAIRLGPDSDFLIYDRTTDTPVVFGRDRATLLIAPGDGTVVFLDDYAPVNTPAGLLPNPLQRKVWIERLRFWALALENAEDDA